MTLRKIMKTILIIFFVLTYSSNIFAESKTKTNTIKPESFNKPTLLTVNQTQVLKLPDSLNKELLSKYPDYRLPNENEFEKDSDWDKYHRKGLLPYVVQADLNADQKEDTAFLIVNKKDIHDFHILSFLSKKSGYELVRIAKGPLSSKPQKIHNYALSMMGKCLHIVKIESEGISYCYKSGNLFEEIHDTHDE